MSGTQFLNMISTSYYTKTVHQTIKFMCGIKPIEALEIFFPRKKKKKICLPDGPKSPAVRTSLPFTDPRRMLAKFPKSAPVSVLCVCMRACAYTRTCAA